MRIVPDLCCTLDTLYYCTNCKWRLCSSCYGDLRDLSDKMHDKFYFMSIHHSEHSLCIKRSIEKVDNFVPKQDEYQRP